MRSMPTTAIAALALAAFPTSVSADPGETTAGLQKPSVRILADQHNAVPTSGTFGFGMSVFRVEAGPEVALATVDSRLRSALRSGFAREGLAYAEEAYSFTMTTTMITGMLATDAPMR